MLPNGPFTVSRVVEFEWHNRAPDFLFRDVTAADFQRTRTASDARFVNQESKQLIMSFHSLIVRTADMTLLVDTCVGNHKERPALAEWHQQQRPYLDRLRQAGFHPSEVDYVCCTHLHADHIGWNTQLLDGRWAPTFPNARYLFANSEVDYWQQFHKADPDNAYKNSWADSVLPILEAGQADLVSSEFEIATGVRLQPAPGHTPGNVVILLENDRQKAVMSGDVIHHPVQIERPEWSSNFCLDPVQSSATRHKLLQNIADTNTILLAAHFAGPGALRVITNNDGFFYADLDG